MHASIIVDETSNSVLVGTYDGDRNLTGASIHSYDGPVAMHNRIAAMKSEGIDVTLSVLVDMDIPGELV